MRSLTVSFVMLLSFLILTACPLESGVPVAEPTAGSLDGQLVGVWNPVEVETGTLTVAEFVAFNDAEYYVELREYRSEGLSNREQYRAWIVTIGDQRFLQLQRLGTKKYNLARFSITDSVLSLRFVGDKTVPPGAMSDQAALRSFIEKNLAGTALDDEGDPILLARSTTQ